MARTCQRTRGGASIAGTWSLDAEALRVVADGGLAESYRLAEVAGLGGDEYAITLKLGAETITLNKLGSEGATLLATLRRTWPPLRAQALRLTGNGEPKRFVATAAAAGGASQHAQLLLYDDALLVAPDGADLAPTFLALLAAVSADASALAVTLAPWSGESLVVTKLAGQSDEFVAALQARRATLAAEAGDVLAKSLPSLAPDARATLASRWLPGHALALGELEALCPGFRAAFTRGWLATCPRGDYGAALLERAAPERAWVVYGRPNAKPPAPAGEGEAAAAANANAAGAPAAEPDAEAPTASEQPQLLWLLVDGGERWFLEAVSERDWATYRFTPGDLLPALVSELACAAQFSREALYLPLEQLTGERAMYAIAARDLPFLRALRERFAGRVIHTNHERWRAGLDAR